MQYHKLNDHNSLNNVKLKKWFHCEFQGLYKNEFIVHCFANKMGIFEFFANFLKFRFIYVNYVN